MWYYLSNKTERKTDMKIGNIELGEKPIKVIIDTDTANEADDQYALAYALGAENIDVLCITAAPFTHTDGSDAGEGTLKSFDEASKIVSLCKSDVPVKMGASSFMKDTETPILSEASEAIINIARNSENPIVLCGIGAGTNIASAILAAPDIADKVIVLWQAGNSPENGNGGEYNMCEDISAAKVIFDSGVKLILCTAYEAAAVLVSTLGELRDNIRNSEIKSYLIGLLERYTGSTADETKKIIWDIGVMGILSAGAGTFEVRDRPMVVDGGTYEKGTGEFVLCTRLDRDKVYADMFDKIGK